MSNQDETRRRRGYMITKVCISGVTFRQNKAAIQNKIKNVNNILTRVCDKNKWTYIDKSKSNVDYTCP